MGSVGGNEIGESMGLGVSSTGVGISVGIGAGASVGGMDTAEVGSGVSTTLVGGGVESGSVAVCGVGAKLGLNVSEVGRGGGVLVESKGFDA